MLFVIFAYIWRCLLSYRDGRIDRKMNWFKAHLIIWLIRDIPIIICLFLADRSIFEILLIHAPLNFLLHYIFYYLGLINKVNKSIDQLQVGYQTNLHDMTLGIMTRIDYNKGEFLTFYFFIPIITLKIHIKSK